MEPMFRDIDYFENLRDLEVVKGDLVLLHNPLVLQDLRPIVGSEKYIAYLGRFDCFRGELPSFKFMPGALFFSEPYNNKGTFEILKRRLDDGRLNTSVYAESIYVGDAVNFALEDDSELIRIVGGIKILGEL